MANGEEGTCAMHEIQLAIVHSTGMAKRKKGRVVVDEFPECEDLRKKSLAVSSYLMDKKAKARHKKMQEMMASQGRGHTRIVLPNATRAAGILIHWESLLRERWNLVLYWLSDFKAKELNDDEFWLIAQLSSVLFPICTLVKTVQSDKPGAIAYTFFFTLRTWMVYLTSKKWYVAETRRSEHPEEFSRWDGNHNFPPRTFKGIPFPERTIKRSTSH